MYFRRIPDDAALIAHMDAAIDRAARGSFKVEEWLKESYGVSTPAMEPKEALKIFANAVDQSAKKGFETILNTEEMSLLKREMDVLKCNIKALLDDIEAKDALIGQLQGKITQLEVASEDEKFQALLAKYRELATKVKANEADGSW